MQQPRQEHIVYIGQIAHYLRGQVVLLTGDIKEEEIDYLETLEIIRDLFVAFIYGGEQNMMMMNNPILDTWEHMKLTEEQASWLANSVQSMFGFIIANTIKVIDPNEYVEINWTSVDTGIISQTTNKAYYNESIRQHSQVFTAQELEQRYI
ncbi:hypothetical protein SM033_00199 [Vibrio phage vB_VpaM_sm033]|nr:hypothetical protein SM033_00199 [Vibrio phage vB_VpaM_sm033]